MIQHDFNGQIAGPWIHFTKALQNAIQIAPDGIDDFNRIGSRLPINGYVDLAATVHTHDVGLDLAGVLDLGHIRIMMGAP